MNSRILLFIATVLGLFLLNSCETSPPLPNEPKEVVVQWQKWINTNDFKLARKLSTANAVEWIDWAEKMLIEDGSSQEETPSNFQSIDCRVLNKKAICACVIEELGEIYPDTFLLQQEHNQWLVDIPKEDLEFSTTLDSIFQKDSK